MAKDVTLISGYPVLFYRRGATPGWFYRGEDDDVVEGPFADRDAAVAFALKDMAERSAGRPARPGVRHAA